MNRRPKPFALSLILSSLLLAMLFIPGAQSAVDVVFKPLRQLTYPRSTDKPTSDNAEQQSADQFRVISYGVNPAQRRIIVDVGSADVAVGDAVVAEEVLVGQVAQISSGRAEVTLINDPSFRVIARTDSDARGLVVADYEQLRLTDVALTQQLTQGDTLRALSNQYPNVGQVVIGLIDEIVEDDGLLRSALIRQPLELDNLTYVSIP